MSAYEYTAIKDNGKKCHGVIEAESARACRSILRQQGLHPINITTTRHQIDAKPNKSIRNWLTKQKLRINRAQLALITRQLATLIDAGMPLDEALECVAKQQTKQTLQSLILAVRAKVTEGHSLAAGLAAFPSAFPVIYRTTVAAAEKSGQLAQVLNQLADYTEKQRKIQRQIHQALIYPSVMLLVSLFVVIFLLLDVVPNIIQVFVDTKQNLPAATIFLLAITHAIQHYGWLILALIISSILAIRWLLSKPNIRMQLDHYLLKTPILGTTIANINAARFARSFGILQQASVPVLDALQAAAALVRPLPMQAAIKQTIVAVREGKGIANSLAKCPHFPPMLIHLIHSGEQSGQLSTLLQKAADTQDDDVESLIQSVLTLFEPLMIVVMGGIVLFIVLAVMLPIFSLDQLAGQT